MFSHFLVIVLTMLVLQLILATLVAIVVRGTTPIEGDSGWTARAYARAVSELLDTGQEADIPLVLDLLRSKSLNLPDWDEEGAGVRRYNISTGSDEIGRLITVTVVSVSGEILAQEGSSITQKVYPAGWDELVAALSGVQNPYELSRLLTLHDSGLLLGSVAIPGVDGKFTGVVLVEMYPSYASKLRHLWWLH